MRPSATITAPNNHRTPAIVTGKVRKAPNVIVPFTSPAAFQCVAIGSGNRSRTEPTHSSAPPSTSTGSTTTPSTSRASATPWISPLVGAATGKG